MLYQRKREGETKVLTHTWSRPSLPNRKNQTFPPRMITRFCTRCGTRHARTVMYGFPKKKPDQFYNWRGEWEKQDLTPECQYDPGLGG